MFRRAPNILWFFLIALTVVIAWGLGLDLFNAYKTLTWVRTPCRILHAHFLENASRDGVRYQFQVEYVYQFGGQEYHSRKFGTGEQQELMDATNMERVKAQFGAGREATCLVNPRHPSEAVLERGDLWGVVFLLGPVLIIGLMGHEEIFAWFANRRKRHRVVVDPPMSDLNDALALDGRRVMFGFIGLVMGVFLLGFCVAKPLYDWNRTQGWVETDTTIQHSEVTSHSSMHGPEYSLNIVFEYQFNGNNYKSDNSGLGSGIDTPAADMADWVAAHPVGTRTRCWVNSADPKQAVLERRLSFDWIAPALGFLMLGFGCFCFGDLIQTKWRQKSLTGDRLVHFWQGRCPEGAVTLRVSPPRWIMTLACLMAGAVFVPPGLWSLGKFSRGISHGQNDLLNLLYGLGAMVAAGYFFFRTWKYLRQAIKPSPVLTISPGTLRPGQGFQLDWTFCGGVPRSCFCLLLEGCEEAKVRRTTPGVHGSVSEEKTQRTIFQSIQLAKFDDVTPRNGTASGRVPSGSMHTFRGVKGGIRWQIRVQFGDRPEENLEYTFPVTVAPNRR